ncbi:hypothetical protein GCM10018780_26060 [Streptomyces lanatus]|nr:hypothetical protein GCM10018780_26060 [Streptomyces lanatus]
MDLQGVDDRQIQLAEFLILHFGCSGERILQFGVRAADGPEATATSDQYEERWQWP